MRPLICALLVALPVLGPAAGCAPQPRTSPPPGQLELDRGFTDYCRNTPDAQCQLPQHS